MLRKVVVIRSGFPINSFHTEFSDWARLAGWVKRNPARLIYGLIGFWLSVLILWRHNTQTESFVAEHRALNIGESVYDLLMGIWLLACMFSFFSERPGAKWLRRSLIIFVSWGWLLNLWDIGTIGIAWIAPVWILFIVAERSVIVLDEAASRKRSVRYILFTVALTGLLTSLPVVFLLNEGNLFEQWPFFIIALGFAAVSMTLAYDDRSRPEGAVLFSAVGFMKVVITILIVGLLLEIIEIAFGMPTGYLARVWWVQENMDVSNYWAHLVNLGITSGLLGVGMATTWLAKTLYHASR